MYYYPTLLLGSKVDYKQQDAYIPCLFLPYCSWALRYGIFSSLLSVTFSEGGSTPSLEFAMKCSSDGPSATRLLMSSLVAALSEYNRQLRYLLHGLRVILLLHIHRVLCDSVLLQEKILNNFGKERQTCKACAMMAHYLYFWISVYCELA